MFRKILQSKWLTIALALVLSLVALSVLRTWPLVVTANKETRNLQQKIDEASRNLGELEKTKEHLSSPTYLERQARIKLNFKRPDEKVVFVYQKPYNLNPTASAAEDNYKPWWRQWLKWLREKLSRV